MQPFVYNSLPGKVVFGRGTLAQVGEEVRALGCSRALVLTTPRQEGVGQAIAAQLGDLAAGIFSGAAMHTPVEVTERAMAAVSETGADCVVAIGGGSTTGLGKAIALESSLPILAIPTTYAGSEMTTIYGITEGGMKKTGRDARVLPKTVIYDPDLTLSLPAGLSATSGMNAVAHSVEALYAVDGNPIIAMIAEEGIRALAAGLPAVVANPKDAKARADALYGAWLCGVALNGTAMALHHKLCHTLGGSFNLPHAETHTVVLPHATAYNAKAAPQAMARIARALSASDAAQGLYALEQQLGTPLALKDIGMPESGLDQAADLAAANPYPNPAPLDRAAIRRLLDNAWHGRAPAA